MKNAASVIASHGVRQGRAVSDLAKAGGRAFNRLIIVHAERQTNGLAQVRHFGQVGGSGWAAWADGHAGQSKASQ